MAMFLEAISNFGSATINIPLALLVDSSHNVFSTIGVAIPAVSAPHLASIGLFDHKAAETVSKSIFESAGKTLTGHWMDCTGPHQYLYPQGVSVGWHRIRHHHFLTDGIKAVQSPDLSVIDFYKHLGTDIVTRNGLPILPEECVRNLATLLGTSSTKVAPWIHMNVLDMGASIFAVAHTGSNVISVMSGTAQWGVGYAANTFGAGALKIAAGIPTKNPILIGCGAADIACGAVTAHQYYSQPFFCGVPVAEILQSATVGASFGAVLGLTEVLFSREQKTNTEKLQLLGQRISTSTLLSSMSAISVPLGITTSFALTGFSLAKNASESVNQYVKAIPVKAGLAHEIDQFIANKYVDSDVMRKMTDHLQPCVRIRTPLEEAMLLSIRP
ncbi:hypothetical protein [cf. Phormidesmis sp. LEGE 11477]|uniref:hypothetical protein n=1 Tax=cf. Phormidesmis sp. LEGE 11477 TaxID=1828680 RepID=UPI00187FA9B9|nr:hypothetical protein [cf. Phormidesmis sp. LEGE 11477]MBE9062899.1 hypothetical protein [cf. Phormidesmis sp. LEGE 11477]